MKSKNKYYMVFAIIILALGAGIISAIQYYEGVKKEELNDKLTAKIQAAQSKSL